MSLDVLDVCLFFEVRWGGFFVVVVVFANVVPKITTSAEVVNCRQRNRKKTLSLYPRRLTDITETV